MGRNSSGEREGNSMNPHDFPEYFGLPTAEGSTMTGWSHDCPLCRGEATVKYHEWSSLEPKNHVCVKCGAKFTAGELADILAYNE